MQVKCSRIPEGWDTAVRVEFPLNKKKQDYISTVITWRQWSTKLPGVVWCGWLVLIIARSSSQILLSLNAVKAGGTVGHDIVYHIAPAPRYASHANTAFHYIWDGVLNICFFLRNTWWSLKSPEGLLTLTFEYTLLLRGYFQDVILNSGKISLNGEKCPLVHPRQLYSELTGV